MKKYSLILLFCLAFVAYTLLTSIVAQAEMMNMTPEEHAHMMHSNRKMHADPFGGTSHAMGADCGSTILCPSSSPHEGYHTTINDWSVMSHGRVNLTSTFDFNSRGRTGFSAPSHFMIMADHSLFGGDIRFTLGASLDPLFEARVGKPQLLQTGEEYKGQENIDVQHRHKLITNVSTTYVHAIDDESDWFCSASLVGDASGIPMEFHRASALRFVDVSLFHHGTTDKHITSSVFTCGLDYQNMRFSAMTFHGMEPTSNPYAINIGTPDSVAGSFQYSPTPNWALMLYYANIHHAERSEVGNIKRTTAGVMYNLPLEGTDFWATSVFFTHDQKETVNLNMLVVESTLQKGMNTFYTRIDAGEKEKSLLGQNTFGRSGLDLTLVDHSFDHEKIPIVAFTVGYARTLWEKDNLDIGVGADLTGYAITNEAKKVYGDIPFTANAYVFMDF